MFDPMLTETATPTAGPKASTTPDAETTADGTLGPFALIFEANEPEVPKTLALLPDPSDLVGEPDDTAATDTAQPDLDTGAKQGAPLLDVALPLPAILPASPQAAAPENAPLSRLSDIAPPATQRPDAPLPGSALPTQPPQIAGGQPDMALQNAPQQTSPTPHAHGSKGPNSLSSSAEDPTMQLSRPSRLRTFPAAVARSALAEPVPIPASDAASVRTVPPVAPVFDASDDPSEHWPKTHAPHLPLAKVTAAQPLRGSGTTPAPAVDLLGGQTRPAEPISHHVISTDARPLPAAPSQIPPPPTPQVLAAYTTAAPLAASGPTTAAVPETPPDLLELPIARAPDAAPLAPASRSVAPVIPGATPEHVAAQLSQIAQNTALHRRDILLHPEELGRVRMNLSAQDSAVHVAIMVERPETLDLMRRYITQLSSEFRDLGYDDVSFDFAQSGEDAAAQDAEADTQGHDATEARAASAPASPHGTDTAVAQPTSNQTNGTLDLRI